MSLDAELPILIQHKVHRIHHHYHHYQHYQHIHQVLPHHYNHHDRLHEHEFRKSHYGLQQSLHNQIIVDKNHNGYIDDNNSEFDKLINHQKSIDEINHQNQNDIAQTFHSSSSHIITSIQQQQQKQQQHLEVVNNVNKTTNSKFLTTSQRTQVQFFLIAAFAYILSPIDLIPEAIFGIFGIIDDIVFLLLCLLCIAIILIYPIFREMQRTVFDKLGLKEKQLELMSNKHF